ncbi:hypothetical protein HUJ05_001698, partial [Dendroctonus ponderosae]
VLKAIKQSKKGKAAAPYDVYIEVLKLFLNIIHTRIYNRSERDIAPTHFAFRQGFGTREALFSLTSLLQKCRDHERDVFLYFRDYEKAFDSYIASNIQS